MNPENGEARVLVVDDDEGMVATLRDILGVTGYQVDVALSGLEAVDRVRQQAPDCILMDIRMPGLNGVEAFREIKRLAPESFVIFMTAYAASTLVEDARREGAVEVVPKPLDLERVLSLIEETAQKTPVLVVDDDSPFCHSLASALEVQDFDVHAVQDVDDAIRLFEQEPRRVVILDMQLEGRSGLDVLLILREINPRAVVILMTGFPDLQDQMKEGLSMSAAACLSKPFEVEDLIREVRGAIELRRGMLETPLRQPPSGGVSRLSSSGATSRLPPSGPGSRLPPSGGTK